MNEPGQREEAVFEVALQLPADQRAAYLDNACAGDPELRRRVEALLDALERAGGFMKQPASPERPMSLSASPTEKPGDRIGRYKLLEHIGEGGCGVVYVAEQEEPVRRRVALKIIKLGMDTKQVIARFDAERQALALMDHPNIAKIHDAGVTETGRPYFVMELVRGVKITDYCDQDHLSPRERLDLFIQVCRAIQHAHQKGVIHRDIKPSNILVTLHDGVPVPKVIDFGIAKATQGRLTDQTVYTAFEQFIGTPAYMSPEQAEMSGLDIDTRSDIYSLGVLLYELLTGKTPFDAKELLAAGLDEMRRTIREVEPVKPSTRLTQEVGRVALRAPLGVPPSGGPDRVNAGLQTEDGAHGVTRPTTQPSTLNSQQLKDLIHALRGDLDWIVMKCLEKDRTRRYETANGLATDITRHLSNEPIVARPPSQLYRFEKLVRRNKLAFAAGAGIAMMLLLGTVVSTWQAIRATRAEREQTRLRQLAEIKERKSEQVAQFMKDMLASIDPVVAMGRDTALLREILDRTAERIGKDLTNQPEVKAELQSTIADVYYSLGERTKAEEMHREALRIRKKLFGDEHLGVAASLDGVAYMVFDEAYNLPESLRNQGKLDEAEHMNREALATRRSLLGAAHPEVAQSLDHLAALLNLRGNPGAAETLEREALDMRRKLLGNRHSEVAKSLDQLSQMLRSQHKLSEAEMLGREALAMRRELLGNEHPHVATALYHLGLTLQAQGKLAEAETMYRSAVEIRKKLLGNEHPFLLGPLPNLANVLYLQRKLAEAVTVQREVLAIRRKDPGNEPRKMANALETLAHMLVADEKFNEAEPFARECVAIRAKVDPDSWNLFADRGRLGAILAGQKKYAEAEPLLLNAYEGLKQREDKIPANDAGCLPRTLKDLIQLYEDWGKPDKTAEWKARRAADTEATVRKTSERYRKRAEAGDAQAQVQLAWRYQNGIGLATNFVEAAVWYRKAAEQGHRRAQLALAKRYAAGLGVEKNQAEAANWLRKAAGGADPNVLNEVAWQLATSPEPGLRDGTNAIAFAEKAVAATGRTNVMYIDTLAAACAEAGQFEKAVSAQKEAMALATEDEKKRDRYEDRLKLYQSNTPYRQNQ
jgi:eukaryotic-like serine/threonine-protein kinase